jgi:CopA family copper-resistance protein
MVTRREFVRRAVALGYGAGLAGLLPAYGWEAGGLIQRAASGAGPAGPRSSRAFDLFIGEAGVTVGDRGATAMTINGTLPGPLLRMREGDEVTIRVTNELEEDTSLHWHGLIVPNGMDGVPGVNFPGIRPGETFVYRYPVRQSGTYWYHSHSGLQEQSGVYGPLIIDPAEPDPIPYDREHVVVLSDWTFEDPHAVLANLKKQAGYYNFQKRTVAGLFGGDPGERQGSTLADRLRWGKMRMDPTDLADVTGATYTYLMNGRAPASNWTGLFRPGERVRLRLINAAAGSFFDVRVPGLAMTVVQADGQNVEPVTVEEFRIAIAETYDVIVEPDGDRAYTVFAESMDRSGYARGTLAPRTGMNAPVPGRRTRPLRTMADMGMDMSAMEMGGMERGGHGGHGEPAPGRMATMAAAVPHGPNDHGPGNAVVPEVTRPRLDDPGVGLGGDGRRVLLYSDLRSVKAWKDARRPAREVELHLTGNMERYMWSFDGRKFSQAPEPIPFGLGERLRLTFVNDTMMEHPIHLHGMWMELDNGSGARNPRKHTVNVKPAERLSVNVTPYDPGPWALHCHVLYHMETGMFRVVSVRGDERESA